MGQHLPALGCFQSDFQQQHLASQIHELISVYMIPVEMNELYIWYHIFVRCILPNGCYLLKSRYLPRTVKTQPPTPPLLHHHHQFFFLRFIWLDRIKVQSYKTKSYTICVENCSYSRRSYVYLLSSTTFHLFQWV